MKTCTSCKQNLPFTEFYKNSSFNSGLQSSCKKCIKKYRQNNKEKILERQAEYYQKNKGKIKQYNAEYRKKNRKKINKYCKKRRQTDPLYKLSENIRSNISQAFSRKGFSKKSKTANILGCSFEDFAAFLEQRSELKLHDTVQLDHVIPLAWAKNEQEILLLNHYSNFQLLTPEDNLLKSDNPPKSSNLNRVLSLHPQADLVKKILDNFK